MLHPTILDGKAAPLPYQIELAAISTDIAKMQQHNSANSMHQHHMTMQPFDITTELAAISAAVNRMKKTWPTVPPPLAVLHLPLPAPSTPDPLLNDDDDNNHHDAKQTSSITDVFNAQLPMLRTLNMLVVELIDTVAVIITAIQSPTFRILSSPPATLHLSTLTPTICHKNATQPHTINPAITQFPPWLLHHTYPCNKRIPVKKFSLHCKYIPAKPPFPHGHHNLVTANAKDRLCLP